MGHVDQADVKANVMGLSRMMSREWHDKQLFHLIESAVVCSHANYNLDPHPEVKPESFTEHYHELIGELLEMSPNYRKYNVQSAEKRKYMSEVDLGSTKKKLKFSHKKKTVKVTYKSKKNPVGTATERGLKCRMRNNLGTALRWVPKKGTGKNPRPTMRRIVCAFCGRKSTIHMCRGCDQSFCLSAPTHLKIPGSNPPRHFPENGLMCWQLLHGFSSWAEYEKSVI